MAAGVRIHDTLSRRKEPLSPVVPGRVGLYSCGPTTYDLLHVGNGRALVVGDLIHRALRALGHDVTFVRNYTDVDDKIIGRAREEGADPLELAERRIEDCERDMGALGLLPPTHAPRVSGCIPEITAMVGELVAKGNAYVAAGEVLFHVPSFGGYGRLSGKDPADLAHGSRVATAAHKRHPADFVLWKPSKEGEPSWGSPWGDGRPGWHIECSAMARAFLGDSLDVHHGGMDLVFPHHENEIAQSEAATGRPFCGAWAHHEFVRMGRGKMAKSRGGAVTLRGAARERGGAVLRHLLGSVHHRSPIEWSGEALDRAARETERLHRFAGAVATAEPGNGGGDPEGVLGTIDGMREDLADDFNVPGAMGRLFSLARAYNRDFGRAAPDAATLGALRRVVAFAGEATGLVREDWEGVLRETDRGRRKGLPRAPDEAEVERLLEERRRARGARDFARADEVREELAGMGVSVRDAPDGTSAWSWAAPGGGS